MGSAWEPWEVLVPSGIGAAGLTGGSSTGVAGQKGKATGSKEGEAGVRSEPSLQGRPMQGCVEEARPYRWRSWRGMADPLHEWRQIVWAAVFGMGKKE